MRTTGVDNPMIRDYTGVQSTAFVNKNITFQFSRVRV